MRPVLLDTNALLWLMQSNSHLGSKSRSLIERTRSSGGLLVSAVSFWEVARAEQRGRVRITPSLNSWRRSVLDLGIAEVPLDGAQVLRAIELLPDHRDIFDRFILASAESRDATLVTSDETLLNWQGSVRSHDAHK